MSTGVQPERRSRTNILAHPERQCTGWLALLVVSRGSLVHVAPSCLRTLLRLDVGWDSTILKQGDLSASGTAHTDYHLVFRHALLKLVLRHADSLPLSRTALKTAHCA